jgi:malate dehydrogenase (oxaloacetate-decarboxylating)(NADP+)
MVLAGLHSASEFTRKPLSGRRYLFFGAGEAGTGIADLLVEQLKRDGSSEKAARHCCWFIDSKGLVVSGRPDLAEHKVRYAHQHSFLTDPVAIVEALRPGAIIGVSGQPGAFSELILKRMGELNERPIIFALSNPTSKSECTAEAAYRLTNGRAIFACGSPFNPVVLNGKKLVPSQGNNAYIFPGLGLGIVASQSRRVTNAMLLAAARALAAEVTAADLAEGRIYPPLARIREVSVKIALAVSNIAYSQELTVAPRPVDLEAHIRAHVFVPSYTIYP